MSLTVVHVGEPKAPFVRAGIEHYRRKILPLASLEFKKVREEALRKGRPVEEVRRREAERIRKTRDPRSVWVVLDQGGREIASEEFAGLIERWALQGKSRHAFLIGGPSGLSPDIRKEADFVLSLSVLTLSHELALLVLVEQLYRALAILNRLPYPR